MNVRVVAYHEAGHTIVGLTHSSARDVLRLYCSHGVEQVVIWFLYQRGSDVCHLRWAKGQLAGLMGGRVAEKLFSTFLRCFKWLLSSNTAGTCNGYWDMVWAKNLDSQYEVIMQWSGQFTTDKSYSAHTKLNLLTKKFDHFSWGTR